MFGLDRLLSRVLMHRDHGRDRPGLPDRRGDRQLAHVGWPVVDRLAWPPPLSWTWDSDPSNGQPGRLRQDLDPTAAWGALISGLDLVGGKAELDRIIDVVIRATRAREAQLWETRDGQWSRVAADPARFRAGSPELVDGRFWWIK